MVLVGIPDGNLYAPLDACLLRRKGLKIKQAEGWGIDVASHRSCDQANSHLQYQQNFGAPRVDLTSMISHTWQLEEVPEAFAAQAEFRDGVLRYHNLLEEFIWWAVDSVARLINNK